MRPTSLLAIVLLMLPVAAHAAPTVQLFGGRTVVALDDDFLGALDLLELDAEAVRPARLHGTTASFRIPTGALDLETLAGDVFHSGGLLLTDGVVRVALLNFVIDTTASPVLTGLVSVDGDLVGRIALFDLALGSPPELLRRGRILHLDGVDVTLTLEAANALNMAFGVSDFFEGLDVGDARLFTRVVARNLHDDDDRNDDEEEDDDDEDDDS